MTTTQQTRTPSAYDYLAAATDVRAGQTYHFRPDHAYDLPELPEIPSRADRLIPADVTPSRRETLLRAIELGADDATVTALAERNRVRQSITITLPYGRYHSCSRAKDWARKGRGKSAEWGEKSDDGFEVGPGKWLVHSDDGFKRTSEVTWDVEHIQVGTETWTIAD